MVSINVGNKSIAMSHLNKKKLDQRIPKVASEVSIKSQKMRFNHLQSADKNYRQNDESSMMDKISMIVGSSKQEIN